MPDAPINRSKPPRTEMNTAWYYVQVRRKNSPDIDKWPCWQDTRDKESSSNDHHKTPPLSYTAPLKHKTMLSRLTPSNDLGTG